MNHAESLQDTLSSIYGSVISNNSGKVANYIPQLSGVAPDKFGMHLMTIEGDEYGVGDNDERFLLQSITKVLLLARAKLEVGSELKERVGVEPSGDPFNSLVQLEYERGIPRNPMINAGAIVVCDVLVELLDDPKSGFLSFFRYAPAALCGGDIDNPNTNLKAGTIPGGGSISP